MVFMAILGNATRRLQIAFTGTFLAAMILLGAINPHPVVTLIAVAAALVSFHIFACLTNGFFSAYLEVLNSDIDSAIYSLKTILSAAERSIKIVSGQLSPIAYFSDDVFASLRGAVNHGVKIEIILGETDAKLATLQDYVSADKWNEFIKWIEENKVSIWRTEKRIRTHFIVVDNTHVRIEDPHPKKLQMDTEEKRRARTIFFDEGAEKYSKRFAENLRQAHLVRALDE